VALLFDAVDERGSGMPSLVDERLIGS